MGSQTTRTGLPFPVGTDRVMDGDDAMAALANRLDGSTPGPFVSVPFSKAAGRVAVPVNAAVLGTAAVTFPAGRFTQPPIMNANITSHSNFYAVATAVTASGFTANARNADNTPLTATIQFDWTAVQMTSAAAAG